MWRSEALSERLPASRRYRGLDVEGLSKFVSMSENGVRMLGQTPSIFKAWYVNELRSLLDTRDAAYEYGVMRPFGEEAYRIGKVFDLDTLRKNNYLIDASRTFAYKFFEPVTLKHDLVGCSDAVFEELNEGRRCFGHDMVTEFDTVNGIEVLLEYRVSASRLEVRRILFDTLTLHDFDDAVLLANFPTMLETIVDATLRKHEIANRITVVFAPTIVPTPPVKTPSYVGKDLACDTTPDVLSTYSTKVAVHRKGRVYALGSVLASPDPKPATSIFDLFGEEEVANKPAPSTPSPSGRNRKSKSRKQPPPPVLSPDTTPVLVDTIASKSKTLPTTPAEEVMEKIARRQAADNWRAYQDQLRRDATPLTIDDVCEHMARHRDIFQHHPVLHELLDAAHVGTLRTLMRLGDLDLLLPLLLRTHAREEDATSLKTFLTQIMDSASSES